MGKRRGPKSNVDNILEGIKENEESSRYIVIYDFPRKNSKEFYKGIMELENRGYKIARVQRSVLLVYSKICALALKELLSIIEQKS